MTGSMQDRAVAGTREWQSAGWAPGPVEVSGFVALASEITQTLFAMDAVVGTLADRSQALQGRTDLADDSQGTENEVDPQARLATAMGRLQVAQECLDDAFWAVHDYAVTVEHITVTDRDESVETLVNDDGTAVDW